ncbi:FAD-binding and (Fe-S)-binding domain-containing protein [Psychroflexus maritimus]|uniref:FAD-binding protein n=1 Tax=Psychroflexus maritimus TaxID=2714865 RepID=A0A967E1Q6_9FLAO|nr:FAD-binding and (Fe-S)-binding domain-containing protein [Psychroflexus maritimus]NGZ89029.1 FAD-binding protein [Psychroflexus maritimus]
MQKALNKLKNCLEGELYDSPLYQSMYATDASIYRSLPMAVAYPKSTKDLQQLIHFAQQEKTSLIPRSGGTSLAGQCVGEGIVVDVSKHLNQILSFSAEKKQITVQPGIIRDQLNNFLKPYGLFFGPNTSTSNRCTIGGMFGNNSSGTTSIKYGVTRDHVVSCKLLTYSGKEVYIKPLSKNEFEEAIKKPTPLGKVLQDLHKFLHNERLQHLVDNHFPSPNIHRRNTGYALDELLNSEIYKSNSNLPFNLCKLLAGSEGTLGLVTEITLQLQALPPQKNILLACHFDSIKASLEAVNIAMKHSLFTCELMDKAILDCTKNQLKYKDYRFFIQGDPEAILMLELRSDEDEDLNQQTSALIQHLKNETKVYAISKLIDEQISMAMELRSAGLGLLGNMNGDEKPVACIEDTAVALEDLPNYIEEFSELMNKHQQKTVYYAHAGAGELHLRPILNLKTEVGKKQLKAISKEVAFLVKKYKGSLSGEHGDGRVRASYLPLMLGEELYSQLKQLKLIFDPHQIFNPHKIIDALPIDEDLRFLENTPQSSSVMQFQKEGGLYQATEKCNGSGECRQVFTGNETMCPSYHVTKNEVDSTRARANALREFLNSKENERGLEINDLEETFDLCVSCKACKRECPSSVDVSAFKAEYLQQKMDKNGISLSDWVFGHIHLVNALGTKISSLYNFSVQNNYLSKITKSLIGVHHQRSLPKLPAKSLLQQVKAFQLKFNQLENPIKEVYFFIDEFTNYFDSAIGKECFDLLYQLNYKVNFVTHEISGRALISKGFLRKAKTIANKNIAIFSSLISDEKPLIGLEPSAILSFRDEYIGLSENIQQAEEVSTNVFLIEEFLLKEAKRGAIDFSKFKATKKQIKIHVHCHQKAMGTAKTTFDLLNYIPAWQVTLIPTACCGMAGSFGYEKKHYEVSQAMANQSLIPSIKKANQNVIIVANGTSCRHQIKDASNKVALHPVQLLYQAL